MRHSRCARAPLAANDTRPARGLAHSNLLGSTHQPGEIHMTSDELLAYFIIAAIIAGAIVGAIKGWRGY